MVGIVWLPVTTRAVTRAKEVQARVTALSSATGIPEQTIMEEARRVGLTTTMDTLTFLNLSSIAFDLERLESVTGGMEASRWKHGTG